MKESDIEKRVCEFAKSHGWEPIKMSSAGRRGMPDRMMMRSGEAFFVEFKTENGRLSSLQELRAAQIKANGFGVYVIRSVSEGINLVTAKGLRC